jgi:membrane protease YdiL (CAAX protease family)
MMKDLIVAAIGFIFLLLLLIPKDKNNGEKELFKAQHWDASDVAIVLFSMVALPYSVSFLSGYRWPFLVRLGLNDSFFCLLVIVLLVRHKQRLEILGFKNYDLNKIINNLYIIFLFIVFMLIISSYKHGNDLKFFEELGSKLGSFEEAIFLAMVLIIVPIVEESLFRGILYSPYRKKYGPTKAIFINAFIFFIVHYGLGGAYPNPIAGLVFCLLYEKTESIYPSIVVHSIYNLFAFSLAFRLF